MAEKRSEIPVKKKDFSVLDTEFDSIRERFDNEMSKMEEEMNKTKENLIVKSEYSDNPYIFTKKFIDDSKKYFLLEFFMSS